MYEESTKMKKWLILLIDAARERFSIIKDPMNIQETSFDYAFPCQFDVFSIDYPRVSLLLKTHDKNRPDKEIRIHGPYDSKEFIQSATEDIYALGWTGPKLGITEEVLKELEMDDSNLKEDVLEGCFADFVSIRLNETMNVAKENLFVASTEPFALDFHGLDEPFSRFEEIDPTFAIVIGNFFESDHNQFAKSSVDSMIYLRNYTSKHSTDEVYTEPNMLRSTKKIEYLKRGESTVKGYGAYFFPPLRIGEVKEPAFEDFMKGTVDPEISRKVINICIEGTFLPICRMPRDHEEPIASDTGSIEDVPHVLVSENGLVFIESNSINKSRNIINLIMSVSACFLPAEEALAAHSVRANDILRAQLNKGKLCIPFIGAESILTDRTIVYGLLRRENMLQHIGIRWRSTDWMKKVLKYALKIYSKDERLTRDCCLWLDAYTLLEEGQYSQSLITGWIIIESYVVDTYKSTVGHMIPSNSNIMVNKLRDKNILTEERKTIIDGLFKKRSYFVHAGEEIGQESCLECLRICKQILLERFSRIQNL